MKKSFVSKLITLCAILFCSTLLHGQEYPHPFYVNVPFVYVYMTVVPNTGSTGQAPVTGNSYLFNGLVSSIPDPSQTNSTSGGAASSGSQPDPDPDPDPDPIEEHCELAVVSADPLVMFNPNNTSQFSRRPTRGRWGNSFRISANLGGIPHQYIETASISYSQGATSIAGGQSTMAVDASPWATGDVITAGTLFNGDSYQGTSFNWSVEWKVKCADGSTKPFVYTGAPVAMVGEFSPWRFTHSNPQEGHGFRLKPNPDIDQVKGFCHPMEITTKTKWSVSFDPGDGLISQTAIGQLFASFQASFSYEKGEKINIPYGAGEVLMHIGTRDIHFSRDAYDFLGKKDRVQKTFVTDAIRIKGWRPYVPEVQPNYGCDHTQVAYGTSPTGL